MEFFFLKGRIYDDGNVVEKFDLNSLLNSLVYDVEFPDGYVKKYDAKIRYPRTCMKLFIRMESLKNYRVYLRSFKR